ncbi:uncharacterized protein Z519_09319 [Cladophialophora bantiana CBS 173.52]|uniref:MULE transposase domain-containing protein n=1 Tax=Cladophialophora bantiana (strain ATCC 10958 / CBS 173.52 / CDC B-1940 / NIH 8579) TaxID=1442370 RepID=A0A0D2HGG4_CLAB1|nr:uncharacterized protein Z519_09319 [Cladophialophora bantiana CBS 173.52]KIW89890.1 hypothetical protein Z519_09319 [Cladophialophora bantiana CBS 173.52]
MAVEIEVPPNTDLLGPKPVEKYLNADMSMVKTPSDVPFDPEVLKKRYAKERDKRRQEAKALGGLNQFQLVETDGPFAEYLRDPWVDSTFSRAPVTEDVDVLILGGGYSAQIVASKLLVKGVTNLKLIDKAGGFGGTYVTLSHTYIYLSSRRQNTYQRRNTLAAKNYSLILRESAIIMTIKTNRDDKIRAKFVIPYAGPLHRPKLPGIPGIDRFKKKSFHSSRWDYEYTGGDSASNLYKLRDKRVGIIGTGATAVQIVPYLGEWAKKLYIFQRTPCSEYRTINFNNLCNGIRKEENLIRDGWTDLLPAIFGQQDPSLTPDEAATPWYNAMCKRPCFHDDYLPTFNRPNVHLIDTMGKSLEGVDETGVLANGQHYPVDLLIYATGFKHSTFFSHRSNMEIYGRDGISLTEVWKDGPRTLHGWSARNFPNYFFIHIIQSTLTPTFIHAASETASQSIEPTAQAEEDWVNTIIRLATKRLQFLAECTPGYYNNEGEVNLFAARESGLVYAMATEISPWRARPGCPDHLRGPLEKAVNDLPVSFLVDPANKETYNTIEECYQRLVGYSLSQGFDIVRSSGGTPSNPGSSFLCIYHGDRTRNTRDLEESVEGDKDGVIVSKRQRNLTHIRGTGANKAFTLTTKSLEHTSHPLGDNPLIFNGHRDRFADVQAAKAQARIHRFNTLPFSASRRILDSSEIGVLLTSKEYYNVVRYLPASKESAKTISGLIFALQNEGFVYETRLEEVVDEAGAVVSRKCVQIWFSHRGHLDAAARFIAGSVCIIDATFNTNKLRMPMIVAVGVLNTNKTFPVAFSFCPSENHASYTFFWESLKLHLPERVVAPAVVISDQAKAILSSIEQCYPSASHQICDWHAVEAMKARFRKMGHTTDQIKGQGSGSRKAIEGLADRAWAYIRADTQEAVEARRNDLQLRLIEPRYLDEWREKEDRVVTLFTRGLSNLGHSSSQRSESYHNVVTQITNGQLPLEVAVKRLCQTISGVIKDIAQSESLSLVGYPREAHGAIFKHLRFNVSDYALRKVIATIYCLGNSSFLVATISDVPIVMGEVGSGG